MNIHIHYISMWYDVICVYIYIYTYVQCVYTVGAGGLPIVDLVSCWMFSKVRSRSGDYWFIWFAHVWWFQHFLNIYGIFDGSSFALFELKTFWNNVQHHSTWHTRVYNQSYWNRRFIIWEIFVKHANMSNLPSLLFESKCMHVVLICNLSGILMLENAVRFLPLSMSLKCVFFAILFWLQVLLCILFTSVSCVCKFQRTALLIAHTPSHDPVNLLSLSTHIYIYTYIRIAYIYIIIYYVSYIIYIYTFIIIYTLLSTGRSENRGVRNITNWFVCVCVSVRRWKLKAHDSLHDSLKHSKQLKARF